MISHTDWVSMRSEITGFEPLAAIFALDKYLGRSHSYAPENVADGCRSDGCGNA